MREHIHMGDGRSQVGVSGQRGKLVSEIGATDHCTSDDGGIDAIHA